MTVIDASQIHSLAVDPHTQLVRCPRRTLEIGVDFCRACKHGWLVRSSNGSDAVWVDCAIAPAEQATLAEATD